MLFIMNKVYILGKNIYFLNHYLFICTGQLETNQYEDTLRETFGVNSFVAFTMDKLIQNIVRQVCYL